MLINLTKLSLQMLVTYFFLLIVEEIISCAKVLLLSKPTIIFNSKYFHSMVEPRNARLSK